jgi:hypothetical protein
MMDIPEPWQPFAISLSISIKAGSTGGQRWWESTTIIYLANFRGLPWMRG